MLTKYSRDKYGGHNDPGFIANNPQINDIEEGEPSSERNGGTADQTRQIGISCMNTGGTGSINTIPTISGYREGIYPSL